MKNVPPATLKCTKCKITKELTTNFKRGKTYRIGYRDYIKPLISFNLSNRAEFLEACNYLNYQPLWAIDNLRKGSKY